MEFATWGGIPRYWEVRKKYKTLEQAQLQAIMNKDGLLYEEPMRLFMDDMRSAVQAFSLVNLIGNGCHKLSEIATVLEKPATNFSRPLAQLIDMGYVRKEIPFGEKEENSKKSLYWLDDSFMNFYMQMVSPNKSIIELGLEKELKNKLAVKLPPLYAQVFEELVRESVNSYHYFGKKWGKAYRYWGKPDGKTETEIDLMCLSLDGKSILIGEVKWSDAIDVKTVKKQLAAKIALFALDKQLKVYTAVWVKNKGKVKNADAATFDCNEVVKQAL
jgi:AAA+ ATPase superfamily predicted ATPase